MLKTERHRLIEEELFLCGTVTVKDFAGKIGCSEETVRRDLLELEEQGRLHRVHGGAYTNQYRNQIPVEKRRYFALDEKIRMAELTFDHYLKNKMTVMLDDSSTCLMLAKKIVSSGIKVNLVTNSLMIMEAAQEAENIRLFGIGGEYNIKSASFVGVSAVDMIGSFRADIAFLSPPSIGIKSGLVHNVKMLCDIDKKWIRHADRSVLLMDHSKFKEDAGFVISDVVSGFAGVVTDREPSENWIGYLRQQGVALLY